MFPRSVVLSLLLAPFLGAPASAAPSAPDQAACSAQFKKEFQDLWGADRKAWDEGCKTKDAAALAEEFKRAFIKDCVVRSSPTVSAALFTPSEIADLCARGLPGEALIRAKVSDASAAAGPRGPPEGGKPGAPPPGVQKNLERVEAVTAGVGTKVGGGQIAEIYGEATRNESVVAVAGREGHPGVRAEGAPTAGVNGVKGLRILEPGTEADPQARIARLPYDAKVKALLGTMVQNADSADTQLVLSTLEKYKPKVSFHPDGIDGAYGQAWTEGQGKDAKSFVELSSGYVQDKDGKTWPLTTSGFREELKKNKMELSRSPPTAITRPNSPRKDLGIVDGVRVYEYPDGSQLKEYTPVALTGTLMHEVHHVNRKREGGGVNSFTDERDAHDIAYRFYTRVQQNSGGNVSLDDGKLAKLAKWQQSPALFQESMIEDYIQNGEIHRGEVTLDEQEAAIQKRKAYAEKMIADRGIVDKAALFFGGKDEAAESLRASEEKLASIKNDRALAAKSEAAQKKWREEREKAFRTTLDQGVEFSRKKILGDKKLSKAEKEKRLAELETFRQEGLKDSWTYIPFTKDPS